MLTRFRPNGHEICSIFDFLILFNNQREQNREYIILKDSSVLFTNLNRFDSFFVTAILNKKKKTKQTKKKYFKFFII